MPLSPTEARKLTSKFTNAAFLEAQTEARSRLYPSIFAANYLVLSNRRVRMQDFFRSAGNVGNVLDVGAQYCPYYPLFKDQCESYSSMDLVDTPLVDFACDAEKMPIDENTFDLVLCTQVLEHCNHPQAIVHECYRVLKPGGTLILTVPSIYPVHGYPTDNWRFMPGGMRYLLKSFSHVEIEGELDFPESLASVICHYGHVVTGRLGVVGRSVNPLWNCLTNIWGRAGSWAMRPFTRTNFNAFTMNLWCLARK